jgi:hypothetical protein
MWGHDDLEQLHQKDRNQDCRANYGVLLKSTCTGRNKNRTNMTFKDIIKR